jgi:hypothetical protein
MSSDRTVEPEANPEDDLRPEYRFDYSKARPNRFAASCPPGGRLVVLDPDVAPVFTTAEAVNSALRSIIATMPPTTPR